MKSCKYKPLLAHWCCKDGKFIDTYMNNICRPTLNINHMFIHNAVQHSVEILIWKDTWKVASINHYLLTDVVKTGNLLIHIETYMNNICRPTPNINHTFVHDVVQHSVEILIWKDTWKVASINHYLLTDVVKTGEIYWYIYEQHMRTHAEYKPYVYSQCSAAFSRNFNMKRHMKSCKYKPLLAHWCCKDGKFIDTYRDLYEQHMRTHAEYKPYVCSRCGAAFSRNFNMKRHVKSCKYKPLVAHWCCKDRGNLLIHIETFWTAFADSRWL